MTNQTMPSNQSSSPKKTPTLILFSVIALIVLSGVVATKSKHVQRWLHPSPTPQIPPEAPARTSTLPLIKNVFLIVMENKDFASLTPTNAPYLFSTMIPQGAHAKNYFNYEDPNDELHPSEPNYIWLEAGTNMFIKPDGSTQTILNDADPISNHIDKTQKHLTQLLDKAGISWKSYQSNIKEGICPVHAYFSTDSHLNSDKTTSKSKGTYAPKHNPFVFFDDVTGGNYPAYEDLSYPYCNTHHGTFTNLLSDLKKNTVARYNFITPNLCDDMHDCDIATGDTWLSQWIPKIMDSTAYKDHGAIFLTWDEGGTGNYPIGMIILSPDITTKGYSNNMHYSHSSTLKTIQEIFSVTPLLGHAADSATTDLSDLFIPGSTNKHNQ